MKDNNIIASKSSRSQLLKNLKSYSLSRSILFLLAVMYMGQGQLYAQNDALFENLKFKTNNSDEIYEYVVKTKSGSTYIGELIGIKYKKLEILNKDVGPLQIATADILSIDPVQPGVSPSLAYQASQADKGKENKSGQMIGGSHYFISPSSFTLEKGEGEFQVTYLFFLSGSYGITDNFSIAAGFSIFPGISFNEQLLYLIPRVSFPVTSNIRLGAQMTFLTILDEKLSLIALTSSFGSENKNITIGLSYGLSNGELIQIPVINFAGVLRVSKKIALLMDNYILTEDIGSAGILFSAGVRILSGESAFDLGMWGASGDGQAAAIPYLNYTIRF